MEDLLKEIEEYKELLQAQARDLMKRIIRINGETQDIAIRNFSKSLTDAHGSTNTQISLIEYQINDIKEILEEREA